MEHDSCIVKEGVTHPPEDDRYFKSNIIRASSSRRRRADRSCGETEISVCARFFAT